MVKFQKYVYRHAPIPGGGFVTGFVFHPTEKNILYARTDIGGVYRYDFDSKSWISLVDHVTHPGKWETYPLSIAVDNANPDWLYIAAGDWKNNYLCKSTDRGEHFEYYEMPVGVHGNAPGRATGERLIVDPVNSGILYFGSQTDGLIVSLDGGAHWDKISVCPEGGKPETDIAFVWLDPRSERNGRCQTIVVSTSGKENSPGNNIRGMSLYISNDAGESFVPLPGQSLLPDIGNYPGFVGQRATFDGEYLYVTMAAVGHSWAGWHGYACDMGGRQQGYVIRYKLSADGRIENYKYITPDLSFLDKVKELKRQDAAKTGKIDPNLLKSRSINRINPITGFGGICADSNHPGRLICSTQCCDVGDVIFYSEDRGEHWSPILYNLEIGEMEFDEVPYMKPEYNGGENLIHWLSDLKIDPFDSSRAVFNTGTGIFMTENLDAAEKNQTVIWRPSCRGVEETVHLNVYSPPAGDVKLIDMVGDLGGFAFTDLTRPAENSFADDQGNRYITCLNADFPDSNPMLVAVTARGNWKGKTTGGLIWSEDQCKTWRRLPDPVGISENIDRLIATIRKPNNNSGWTAISADGKTLVWCIADGQMLPIDAVVFTDDLGHSWYKCKVYDLHNKRIDTLGLPLTLKVLSDRVDPDVFYGFGDDSMMYISIDKARTFVQIKVPQSFPKLALGGVDNRMPAEIRAESGKFGVVWISAAEGGLWKITFNKATMDADFKRVTAEGDVIYRQGMGKPAPGSKYKTLYVNGIIGGEYGFYRSFDEGRTWERINDERQMFGDIRSITGDPRVFGRFYIATGSRGVLWGGPVQ